MFNDDIQGTAATVLAGLYGAMKVQGLTPEALKHQRIVVAGAGSAGSGVILTIRNAMNKRYGLTKEEASSRFFIVDKDGLISKHRSALGRSENGLIFSVHFIDQLWPRWRRSSMISQASPSLMPTWRARVCWRLSRW